MTAGKIKDAKGSGGLRVEGHFLILHIFNRNGDVMDLIGERNINKRKPMEKDMWSFRDIENPNARSSPPPQKMNKKKKKNSTKPRQ